MKYTLNFDAVNDVSDITLKSDKPLKTIREVTGATQAVIAKARGVTPESVHYSEKAGDGTSMRLVRETAAAAWGCSLDEIEIRVRRAKKERA